MKIEDNNLMKQAYIDNQLPIEQVIDFEQSLSAEERVEIAQEQQFEAAFAKKIMDDIQCPDEFWENLKSRFEIQPTISFQNVKAIDRTVLLWPTVAAAAAIIVIAVVSGSIFINSNISGMTEKVTVSFMENLIEFAQSSEIPGDYEKVRSSLTQHGFHIKFKQPNPEIHHQVELLGVRFHKVNGSDIAQIYLSCCSRPMSVFLTDKSAGNLSNHVQVNNQPEKMFSVSSLIDKYRLYIVGPHPTSDVLDLFS